MLTLRVHSAVGVLQEVVVLYKVLQYVLGGVHVLFGIHRRVFLLGAIKPAPGPNQIADVVEVALVLVVAPPREISVLGRHQLEIDPLGLETPRAVPPGEVDWAAHRPLHQDVARFVFVLTEPRHGVVFPTAELDTVAVVDLLKHPHSAARHHLQSAELLPEEPVERLEWKGEGRKAGRQPGLAPISLRSHALLFGILKPLPFACGWRTVPSSHQTA